MPSELSAFLGKVNLFAFTFVSYGIFIIAEIVVPHGDPLARVGQG